ncbi:MAG: hypothetical protein A3G18_06950 [Rhodospirillales bacterium RIFCSPLOWO2_12_FULL_58_28]|nr:MAG: hypothetical protein A3H92_11515 [Rhodospirillales bacterium RIFCSPLOWO2_02_FULL_58_16]OHC77458.1 MAG: hypothetical protein A3G18_06950 [Rhodospirillales bacterium RIFCSPLOWO2_12_FULL_58_28]
MNKGQFLGLAVMVALAGGSASAGAPDVKDGVEVYNKRCKACHAIKAGDHKNGPSLAGVFGKNAASTEFPKYLGLKNKKDVVWNEANLDAYLTDPTKFVGEKTMVFKLTKAEERAAVIEYLKTLK